MLLFAHLGLTLTAARFARGGDLAFVFLGSMLPDIIDRPLGLIVFGTPAMGRTYAHTILFLLILVAMAIYFRDIRLASLSGGVLAHLVLGLHVELARDTPLAPSGQLSIRYRAEYY